MINYRKLSGVRNEHPIFYYIKLRKSKKIKENKSKQEIGTDYKVKIKSI